MKSFILLSVFFVLLGANLTHAPILASQADRVTADLPIPNPGDPCDPTWQDCC